MGTIIRSQQYWNDYLSKELENSLYVLTKGDDNATILAWLAIRPRGGATFQLSEFGCDRAALVGSIGSTFQTLLVHVAHAKSTPTNFSLQLPTFLLEEVKKDSQLNNNNNNDSVLQWETEETIDDEGWMYRQICPQEETKKGIPALTQNYPHLIWPADSF